MKLTLGQAAKHAGRAKGTLSKALSNKHISAEKDDKGRWQIDPSELQRWMDANPLPNSTENQITTPDETLKNSNGNSALQAELNALREKIESGELERGRERGQFEDQIADLRSRLDKSEGARERTEARLEDQRNKIENLLIEQRDTTPEEPPRRFFGLLKG